MISKSLLDKIYSIVDPQEYIQGNININEIKDLFGNNMLSKNIVKPLPSGGGYKIYKT